ncbi:MAG: rRNA maturation RNase YbeY [Clostridia bacterium]|nr:rRNA maturation RNase YbeY [Clostridia bacterium]
MVLINFSNRQRKVKLPQNVKTLLTSAVKASLEVEDVSEPAEVNITFVSDEGIKNINRDFRNINKSTDVLSFPLGENGVYDVNPENGRILLGDVIISVEHALMQAETFGHSFEREIAYLTVHSIFHLLGYDHIDEAEEKRIMREREEAALSAIGLQII